MTPTMLCPSCKGAGTVGSMSDPTGDVACTVCDGRGRVPKPVEWEEKKPRKVKLRGGLATSPGPWPPELKPGEYASRVVERVDADGNVRFVCETAVQPTNPSGMVHGTAE